MVFDFGGQFNLDAPGLRNNIQLINVESERLNRSMLRSLSNTSLGPVCSRRKGHSTKRAVGAVAENRNRRGRRHPREFFFQVRSEGARTSSQLEERKHWRETPLVTSTWIRAMPLIVVAMDAAV